MNVASINISLALQDHPLMVEAVHNAAARGVVAITTAADAAAVPAPVPTSPAAAAPITSASGETATLH